jgi:glucose-6-phosphate isomerase
MNEEDQNQSSTEVSSTALSDKEHTLQMAEHVWLKVKGYPIPDCYSEKDRLEIFERYYHRAVSQSQGE